MVQMSLIKVIPSWPMSSRRPTKGDTKAAPAFAARIACPAEKHKVTFTFVPSSESALQVFYIGLAGFGLVGYGNDMEVSGLFHLVLISGAVLGTITLGVILKKTTDAMLPFLDAFTTVFSLVATWLMVNMIQENWLYWIVIDTISIYLYAKRGLKLSSALFFLYLLLALDGYFEAISIF